jgi:hypothetical protein
MVLIICVIRQDKDTGGYQYTDKFKKNVPGNKSRDTHDPAEKRLQPVQVPKKHYGKYNHKNQPGNLFIFVFAFTQLFRSQDTITRNTQ